jgi:threonine-phosphate decarboxylase
MKRFDHGGNIFAIARALGRRPEEFIDFSASINPLGPPGGVRDAVTGALSRLIHYPDSDCTELREALGLYHGLTATNFCIANGSTELIYLLPHLAEGHRAVVIAPPFSEYGRALARGGWDVDHFTLSPANGFALYLDRLAEFLERNYDLLILGNPGNPSGRLYTPAEIEELFLLCRARGLLLVLDEAFMDFCEEGSSKRLAAGEEGIVVLRSMTKFFALPGMRLGYAVGSHGTITRLSQLREPWSVNTLAQVAGLACLTDTGYIAETRRAIAGERARLAEKIAAIPGLRPLPSAANYLLVSIERGPAAGELATRLLDHLVLIRDCSNFRGLNDNFFRVAVRGRDDNNFLAELLADICKE